MRNVCQNTEVPDGCLQAECPVSLRGGLWLFGQDILPGGPAYQDPRGYLPELKVSVSESLAEITLEHWFILIL